MSVWVWLGVACLGSCGALARFVVGRAAHAYLHTLTAVGTFIVNISGALALGFLVGVGLTGNALVLAGAATLGSYTTFSTWMLESERFADDGNLHAAALNIGASVVAGISAVALGHAVGSAF